MAETKVVLRPYQVAAIEGDAFYGAKGIDAILAEGRNPLVVLATGLGKTVTFVHYGATRTSGRVLILSHRRELVFQAHRAVRKFTDHRAAILMGSSVERGLSGQKFICSTMQTASRPKFMDRFAANDFELIVIDEAHRGVCESYQKIVEHFSGAKVLGVTATPQRGDGLALSELFDEVAISYGIEPAVSAGWLCDVRPLSIHVSGLDFSKCEVGKSGEFKDEDIAEVLADDKFAFEMAEPILDVSKGQSTIAFCARVDQAATLAEVLNETAKQRTGEDRIVAAYVHGKTPHDERDELIEAYKESRIQILCNVGVFIEGFDAPNTRCVALCRPFATVGPYIQCVGRGTRTLPGDLLDPLVDATNEERREAIANSPKPFCTLIDFRGSSKTHDLVSFADALGGSYSARVRSEAFKAQFENRNAGDVLESARKFVSAEEFYEKLMEQREAAERRRLREFKDRLERQLKRRGVTARVQYDVENVNPYGANRRGAAQKSERPAPKKDDPRSKPFNGKPDGATIKQVELLIALGCNPAKAETTANWKQAGEIITKLKERDDFEWQRVIRWRRERKRLAPTQTQPAN